VTAETLLRLSNVFTKEDYLSPISGLPYHIPEDLFNFFYADRFKAIMEGPGKLDNPAFAKAAAHNGTLSYLAHMTPKQAIKYKFVTLEQLKSYKCFAFLRDPFDRNLSAFSFQVGVSTIPDMYKDAVKSGRFSKNSLLFRPQTEYFLVDGEQVCEPLMFDDYANELRRMIEVVGGYKFDEIPYLNSSRSRNSGYTKEDYQDEIKDILEKDLLEELTFYSKYRR
jgi:hypothetical protein